MALPIKLTERQALIHALEARRPWAKGIDRARIAAHREAEKAALTKYRDQCRAALKKSYADLKAEDSYDNQIRFKAPKCPLLVEPDLDRVLAALGLSQQETFTIDGGGTWDTAHWLLTHDEDAKRSAC